MTALCHTNHCMICESTVIIIHLYHSLTSVSPFTSNSTLTCSNSPSPHTLLRLFPPLHPHAFPFTNTNSQILASPSPLLSLSLSLCSLFLFIQIFLPLHLPIHAALPVHYTSSPPATPLTYHYLHIGPFLAFKLRSRVQ